MIQSSHDKATQWARRIVADPDVLVTDLETTGLGPDAEIVDVAVIDMTGTVILDQLIRPARPVPAVAVAVHGLTDDILIDAPEFWHVYPMLADAIRGKTLCIFNGAYDTQIIRQVCEAHGLPNPVCGWQCAMLAAADYLGEPGKYPGSYRWPKLDEMCAHFGIDPGGHRALADAEATRLVVRAMAGLAEPAPDSATTAARDRA